MVPESPNELLGSGLTQHRPERLGRLDGPGAEFLTCLLHFSKPYGVRLMSFGPYLFECLLVRGAPVFARNGATLPTLEVLDERLQGAPLLALLLGDLRSPPLHKCIQVGVIPPEIVNSGEKGAAMLV